MEKILLSKTAILVYEILMILILLFIFLYQRKKNRDIQARREIRNAKMRNVQLEEKLKNPANTMDWSKNPNPFDVQYISKAEKKEKPLLRFQVELEVHTETSVQRYLFDLDKEITVGRGTNNVLPLNDRQAENRCCSIFLKNHAVYVRNEGRENSLCIQRGKRKQPIQRQIVKLQNKDILTFGKTALHVFVYEN